MAPNLRRLPARLAVLVTLTGLAAAAPATAGPVPVPDFGTDREVAFDSGDFRIRGSLRLPPGADGPVPAAVIIAGSGPTDRHGNSAVLPGRIDTLRHVADTLAAAGVASLRYDKPGTGNSDLGPLAEDPSSVDFDLYVDLAADATRYLAGRPETDPARIMVAGHSEGALISLVLADRGDKGVDPAALGLLAAPGTRLLDLVRQQLQRQTDVAVAAGAVTEEEARQLLAVYDEAVATLRETGELPPDVPEQLAPILAPQNTTFLHQIDAYDPAELAASLPGDLPVFLACGEGDIQVPCDDTELVAKGLARRGGHRDDQFVRLADVNHVLQELGGRPSTGEEYTAGLPHSTQLREALAAFVTATLTGTAGEKKRP